MNGFEQVLSVEQLSLIVGETLFLIPAGLVVEGEVQKVRIYKDFMVFFELAGDTQSLNCSSTLSELKGEVPMEGAKVQVVGEVSLGKKTDIRFKVRAVKDAGESGNNAKKLEELKLRLRAEGAFDEGRKKSLPRIPKRVAVVTSGSSSAWEDFKRVSSSRFLATEIVLFNTSVQGVLAEQEICSKLTDILAEEDRFDVVAIVRGGGSKADLEVFNSERIVREVLKFSVPVVSGVGHEDDVSLLDLVADKRASTPSNAAEMIFPDFKDLLKEVERLSERASLAIGSKLKWASSELSLVRADLFRAGNTMLDSLSSKLELLSVRLSSLDFEKLFGRGFALLEKDGVPISSTKQVGVGEVLNASLADGKLKLETKEKASND